MRKKVVTIGGGSGSFSLLSGLKKYTARKDDDDSISIKFIAASTDSGGNSGELRFDYGILPVGDMRQGALALSDAPEELKKIFGKRFNNEESKLKGYHSGNIIIAGLIEDYGEKEAWNILHKILSVRGRVVPCTWDKAHISARYEDGTALDREHLIDKAKNPSLSRIVNFCSNKKINANQEALESLVDADAIVIGPGDLYTSIMCNFLADDIADTIRKSKALKIYNCNIMTKPGETPNYSVADHFSDIERYLGKGIIDIVTYNNKYDFDSKLLEEYKKENKVPVRFKEEQFKNSRVKLIGTDLASETNIIRHDSEKISKLVMNVLFPL